MPQVTRAQFASALAAKINDNSAGDITPLDLREVLTDLEDSALWYDEAGTASIPDGAVTLAKIAPTALHGAGAQLVTSDGGLSAGSLHAAAADGRVVAAQTASPGTVPAKSVATSADRLVAFDSAASSSFATLSMATVTNFVAGALSIVTSDTTGIAGASAIGNVVALSQAEYDAIATPDPATLYLITDAI